MVGQTFTHAPQPMQLSRSNSGLPLYRSGTTQGSFGKRVVNRGEKTAVTASFNSLNFGKRNFKLLSLIFHKAHFTSVFAIVVFGFCVFVDDAVFPEFYTGGISAFGDCMGGRG